MKTETENLRELDSLIAEKVFGWSDIEWSQSSYEFPEEPPPRFLRGHLDGGLWREIPHYTTDPAAAMQVLEKCAEALPGGVKVRRRKHDLAWTVAKFEDLSPVWSVSKTLPIAICRFAKALYSK